VNQLSQSIEALALRYYELVNGQPRTVHTDWVSCMAGCDISWQA